jgi:DMSO/TMAO reductase YedYZ molybdopterin-dependent catalytic subunit
VRQRPVVRMPGLLTRRFPAPPERLRVGPLRDGAFASSLHSQRLAAILGISLGVAFSICFLTGFLSHLIQHPPSWFEWPSRPAGLYRITQGLHVATGLLSIPLLLAKLWTVYPRLWTWPPVEDATHLVERAALLPLVGGSIFMLFTGLANIGLWYPWRFFFPAGHYWGAWITMGALVVHIGAKASIVRRELTARSLDVVVGPDEGLTRRGFLGVVVATSGLITLTTIGQTFKPLNFLAVLAPRRPDVGPQGFPVNKSAAGARVTDSARDPKYRLTVEGRVGRRMSLSLSDLRALPQHEATLPIACVEGWSASARWRGVRVRDLLQMAGADDDATVLVESMQPRGLYKRSELNPSHAGDSDTLLALEVNGEVLHFDHGYPLRLIGPNRPGVMQTKWVNRLVVQ